MDKEIKKPQTKRINKLNTQQFTASEVLNIIRTSGIESEKWFELQETGMMRIQPNLKLYLQALEASLDKRFQNRNILYDFYLNTLIVDDVVSSLLEKRLDNIDNKSLQIVDNDGLIISDYGYFFEAPKFRDFLKNIILSKFWGFQLFGFKVQHIKNKSWFDYVTVNHKHVDPYNKHITKTQFNSDPILKFENHPEFLFIGDKDDLGLMSKITKLSIMLRHNDYLYGKYSDLASENFTQIQKKGLVNDRVLDEINKKMMHSGGGTKISSDENVEFKFHNQSSSQQNSLFENRESKLRERLAIIILGQTMTTNDGSSKSQALVHEGEQDDKFSADEQYILDVLNYDFIDYMKLWFPNFDINNKRFKFMPKNNNEIAKKINYYEKLKQLGVVFTDSELRNKFKDII